MAEQLLDMDPPKHSRYRAALARRFAAKPLERLRSVVEHHCDAALARFVEAARSGETFDLVETVAKPVPLLTICALLGVPEEDAAMCSALSDVVACPPLDQAEKMRVLIAGRIRVRAVLRGARRAPPRESARRRRQRLEPHARSRRARAHEGGATLVLCAAHHRRRRDDHERDQRRLQGSRRESTRAPEASGRPLADRHRGRGDPPMDESDHPLLSNGRRATSTSSGVLDPRGRIRRALLSLGQS